MKRRELAVGIMSGTSADGVTFALCEIDFSGRAISVLKYRNYLYHAEFRSRLLKAAGLRAGALSRLDYEIGALYSRLLGKFMNYCGVSAREIACVGSHGQTVVHEPIGERPNTMQIGEISFIAAEYGITAVSDFRSADLAAGGQGAPLVPFLDEFLFGGGSPVMTLNIGGIANLTVTGGGLSTIAFDCGPGNCLMDDYALFISGGKLRCDKGGAIALAGKPDKEKAVRMLESFGYFSMKPPKSLDRSYFSLEKIRKFFGTLKNRPEDTMATLNYFSALCVKESLERFSPVKPNVVYVSGGGVFNKALMKNLRRLFYPSKVESSLKAGIHPISKEAACFALLALAAVRGERNQPLSATGAGREVILGKIVPGRRYNRPLFDTPRVSKRGGGGRT